MGAAGRAPPERVPPGRVPAGLVLRLLPPEAAGRLSVRVFAGA